MDIGKRFSAAVLAGGFSSRMGKDKALLPFRGATMLEHQVQKLLALGITDIMISGSTFAIPGTRFIPDLYPHRGPLSGIHACLSAAQESSVLFLGVDVPLVPEMDLRELLLAHKPDVTLLQHGEKTEPLIGVYDRGLANACEVILQTEHTAVKRLLQQSNVHVVRRTEDDTLYMNCNTEQDYSSLCSFVSEN